MEEASELSVGHWLASGWKTFRRTPRPLVGGAAIIAIVGVLASLILMAKVSILHQVAGYVISYAVCPILGAGLCFLNLRAVRGEPAYVSQILKPFSHFGRVWLTSLLVFLICVGVPTLLLIPSTVLYLMSGLSMHEMEFSPAVVFLVVPMIVLFLKYSLSIYAIMDGDSTAVRAIRQSGRITRGRKGKLFGLLLISFAAGMLTWPFWRGLRHPQHANADILIAVGSLLYVVYVLVVFPWLAAAHDTAYDSLCRAAQEPSAGRQRAIAAHGNVS